MIRKSTLNLKFANPGKLEKLQEIAEEYKRVVNLFIDDLWERQCFSEKFIKDTSIDSWLSARLKQAAAKQALSIVKSQRKKKKKNKPTFNKLVLELDSRFVDIEQDQNSFDLWINLSSIGNKIKLQMPSQKHFHFNKFLGGNWQLKNSIRIRINERGYLVDVYFQKDTPAKRISGKSKAVDIGYKKLLVSSDGEFLGNDSIYKKINRKEQKSKAFKRALTERDEEINKQCKALDLENVKELYVEDLNNVKHKTKGKIHKKFNSKLQRWSYPQCLRKLIMLAEEHGIKIKKIPPQYTSQRCSNCGVVCKSNRQGEIYKCACGLSMDADYNAALNILHIGAYGLNAT